MSARRPVGAIRKNVRGRATKLAHEELTAAAAAALSKCAVAASEPEIDGGKEGGDKTCVCRVIVCVERTQCASGESERGGQGRGHGRGHGACSDHAAAVPCSPLRVVVTRVMHPERGRPRPAGSWLSRARGSLFS